LFANRKAGLSLNPTETPPSQKLLLIRILDVISAAI